MKGTKVFQMMGTKAFKEKREKFFLGDGKKGFLR